jgi:NtrC-family two-component system sensor histidine kinase KinB
MFGLRTKLAVGSLGLLALLVALGVQSTIWLSRLGGSIDVILRENYQSVVACQDMKESLERMDSGALFAFAGDPQRGRALAAVHGPRFLAALDAELHNITLPGEGPLAYRIRDLYTSYSPALAQVLDTGRPLGERRAIYFGRLLPLFEQIKATADQVLQMNQQNMVAANARARGLATLASRRMFVLLVLGAALAVGFVAFLGSAILVPLRRLTQSVQDVERGNLDLVVPVKSRDELGQLAAAFNAMAGRLRELRRSNRARLLRAQQISQQAIDSLPDAVAVFSSDFRVELANRTAVSALGLRPGEAAPARHADWLPHLLEETVSAEGLPDRGYEAALQIFHEGKERFYLPQAVAVRGAGGDLLGVTLILSDVTDLRRLDELKSGMLSTVSHELRTPLTSLQMALHILLEERLGALTPEQTELLVAARDDAERLRQILVNLLEISHFESGRQQLRFEPTSPRDLVELATSRLRTAFADGGVGLAVTIDPQTPRVLADPVRAQLVLSNLLQNALKHTAAGGSVDVAASPAGGAVRFTVADSGDGIPAQYLDKVFDQFFQIPGTEGQGMAGLGLAIAKEIVRAHGGAIGADSHPGRGSTFWFTLPAANGAAAARSAGSAVLAAAAAAPEDI